MRIPDPTTAGDFCRRFSEHDVVTLMDAVNETRLRVWSEQPPEFFTQAIIEGDGTLVEPTPSASRASTSPMTAPGVIILC